MALDSWFPIGYELPDGASCGRPLHAGGNWQIIETRGGGYALVAMETLFDWWSASRLIERGDFQRFKFGAETYYEVSCNPSQLLVHLSDCRSPNNKNEAIAFATALRDTREIDSCCSLHGAVYIEKLSRLLPTRKTAAPGDDGIVLGCWLTGGAQISAMSFPRLRGMLTWMEAAALREVIETAGIKLAVDGASMAVNEVGDLPAAMRDETILQESTDAVEQGAKPKAGIELGKTFKLTGRPQLEAFFSEHVVDIIRNKERYKALGIEFPSATVLHGPPGCGKTFAVEQLVEYLGWPSFQLDASTIASPFIHETSRKVSEMFEKAMRNAPSVLVIDEMEAFLADREAGGGGSHHRVEEVAEFLRRIPEAAKNEVLIIAMTNRVEMIDPAIMRRGRFDHVIAVGYPEEAEVSALLSALLAVLPKDQTVDLAPLAKTLAGRPLSDVAFVVREGARLAARAGSDTLGQKFLLAALDAAPSRVARSPERRAGFV